MASKEVIEDIKTNNGPNQIVRCDDNGKIPISTVPSGGGGGISEVNGDVGPVVVLTSDNIDDSSDTHKFATQTELDQITTNSNVGIGNTNAIITLQNDTQTNNGNNQITRTDGTGKLPISVIPGGGDTVDSVNGQTGVVNLDADDIQGTYSRDWCTPSQISQITFNQNNISNIQGDLTANNGLGELTRTHMTSGFLPSYTIPQGTHIFEGTLPGSNSTAVFSQSFDLATITGIPSIKFWQVEMSLYIYGDPGAITGVPDTPGERWYIAYPTENETAKISIYSHPDGDIDATQFFLFLGNFAELYQNRPYRLVIEWVNDNPTPIIPLPPLP